MEQQCSCRPMQCTFCDKTVSFKDKSTHEHTCELRRVSCANKCGLMIGVLDTEEHMLSHCTHRFVDCPDKCGVKIQEINYEQHSRTDCGNRLLPCPNSCLSKSSATDEDEVILVRARTLAAHLELECPNRISPCGLCGVDVRALHMGMHQQFHCAQRIVSCRVARCLKTLPLADRETHERFQCRFRQVTCSAGCGDIVISLYLGKHLGQTCALRQVECPLHCGEHMRHKYLQNHLDHQCVRRLVAPTVSKGSPLRSSVDGRSETRVSSLSRSPSPFLRSPHKSTSSAVVTPSSVVSGSRGSTTSSPPDGIPSPFSSESHKLPEQLIHSVSSGKGKAGVLSSTNSPPSSSLSPKRPSSRGLEGVKEVGLGFNRPNFKDSERVGKEVQRGSTTPSSATGDLSVTSLATTKYVAKPSLSLKFGNKRGSTKAYSNSVSQSETEKKKKTEEKRSDLDKRKDIDI